MIEVEIRGRLTEEEHAKLQAFFKENGTFIEHQDREMYLLTDYPGYDPMPTKRDTDIRIRNTNGECEIMVKHKASDGNVGRHEISLKLQDNNLDTAKEVVKALGQSKGLRMHRIKDVFAYKNVEWSLADAGKGIYYYEAEKEIERPEEVGHATDELERLARELGLAIFTHDETEEFIALLGREVNTWVTF